jgi:hypothetical protein
MTNEQETRWQKQRTEFKRLEALCDKHHDETGDFKLANVIASAYTNASCTYPEGELNPDFYRVALASIADCCNSDGRDIGDVMVAWFNANGFEI